MTLETVSRCSAMATLTDESDVPGTSLDGRKPEDLKNAELKHWLMCRGASTKGKKADLVARYEFKQAFTP